MARLVRSSLKLELGVSAVALVAAFAAIPAAAQTTTPTCENGQVSTDTAPCLPQASGGAFGAPVETTAPAAASSDEIVVTGSRIARPRGSETASPLQTVTSQDLDARGYQTVAQALNELPAFGVPGASPVGFNQSSFGAGQSFVDFLGLGSQRTLTLVNGRRFVSGNTASIFGPTGSGGNQVDLNTIPTKLIDRSKRSPRSARRSMVRTRSPAPSTSYCGAITRASISMRRTASPSGVTPRTIVSACWPDTISPAAAATSRSRGNMINQMACSLPIAGRRRATTASG